MRGGGKHKKGENRGGEREKGTQARSHSNAQRGKEGKLQCKREGRKGKGLEERKREGVSVFSMCRNRHTVWNRLQKKKKTGPPLGRCRWPGKGGSDEGGAIIIAAKQKRRG